MEFNAYSMLVDFMWAGIFLFVAKMLREKIIRIHRRCIQEDLKLSPSGYHLQAIPQPPSFGRLGEFF